MGIPGPYIPGNIGARAPIFPGIQGPGSPFSREYGDPGSPYFRENGDPLEKMGTPVWQTIFWEFRDPQCDVWAVPVLTRRKRGRVASLTPDLFCRPENGGTNQIAVDSELKPRGCLFFFT